MELLLTTFFLLFIVATVLKSQNSKKYPTPKLPPGPWKLPVIGNLHQIIRPQPHETLRDLANKYGPMMWLQMGEVPTIVVSSAETAKQVLKTNDSIFSQRPYLLAASIMAYNLKGIIFAPYGNYWRHVRKICMMELLISGRVQSFKSIREEEVSALIRTIADAMNEGSPVNLSEKIFSLTYSTTARAAFGKKNEDEKEFIRIAAEVSKLAGGFCLVDMFPSNKFLKLLSLTRYKLEKLHRDSDRILDKIVKEHIERRNQMEISKSNGNNNDQQEHLVDVLLKLQQHAGGDFDFPLTNDNIKAIIQDIFGAGSETSSTTLEWAMAEIVKNPRVMKKAQDEVRKEFNEKGKVDESGLHELELLSLVVKETLRLHPAGPLSVLRECSEKCMISGYQIPANTKLILNLWAIGRDPKHWKEAKEFHPERFSNISVDFRGLDFEFIPFGAGRRICPGTSYALPNIMLPLAQLLYHFDWELPNGLKPQDLDMSSSFGLTVRRKNDLVLTATSYRPF